MTAASPNVTGNGVTTDVAQTVRNCSRIGLRANPPRLRLLDLLLPSRRR